MVLRLFTFTAACLIPVAILVPVFQMRFLISLGLFASVCALFFVWVACSLKLRTWLSADVVRANLGRTLFLSFSCLLISTLSLAGLSLATIDCLRWTKLAGGCGTFAITTAVSLVLVGALFLSLVYSTIMNLQNKY